MKFGITRRIGPLECDYEILQNVLHDMIDEMNHQVNALKYYERTFEISAEIYGEISHRCLPFIDIKNHTIMGIPYVVRSISEMPAWTINLLYDDKESRKVFETWSGYGGFTAQIEKNALNYIYGTLHDDRMSRMKFDLGKDNNVRKLKITKVIFNDPATIVFWNDGTKTVVKCGIGDTFDPEKGLAMAYMKKAMGNKGNYFNEVKKWVDPYITEK